MEFEQAWLSYRMIGKDSKWGQIGKICADLKSPVMQNAVNELQRAWKEMTGTELVKYSGLLKEDDNRGCIRFVQDGKQLFPNRLGLVNRFTLPLKSIKSRINAVLST